MMARLTREEQEIVDAFERNELRSPRNKAEVMKQHRAVRGGHVPKGPPREREGFPAGTSMP